MFSTKCKGRLRVRLPGILQGTASCPKFIIYGNRFGGRAAADGFMLSTQAINFSQRRAHFEVNCLRGTDDVSGFKLRVYRRHADNS